MHLDNSKVVEIFEDGNLVVDGKNGVTVSAKELFLQDFDGTVVVASKLFTEVDLRSVALSERL